MEKSTTFKSLAIPALLVFLTACSDTNGLFEESTTDETSGSADADASADATSSGTTSTQELENTAPLVDVGADQSLELPITKVQVLAEISDDGDQSPSMVTYEWTQVSGPSTAVIVPGTLSDGVLPTDITVDVVGSYVLRLTASDGELSSFDEITVTLSTPPVGGGPRLSGITGYWRLDDNGGTQALNSINPKQSGTLLNLDESHWAPGVYNSGLCFDGEFGQHVSILTAAPELTTDSITVSGWVQVDNTFNKWAWVAGQGDNYGLWIADTGILTFFYYGTGWLSAAAAAPSVLDGGWHHVAGTFDADSSVVAVYLDGVQLKSKITDSSIIYKWGEGFSLGSNSGNRNFKGCLDEIQTYGRALSGTEVRRLYQQ